MTPNIVTIVGKSNSGKTTLIVKLIKELTRRGHLLGTVKHTHDGFTMDEKGKDSWRHQEAGAASTLVVTSDRAALIKYDDSPFIERMKAYLGDRDLILAEGFKTHPLPKIEIFRTKGPHASPLCMADEHLVAFVTDSPHRPPVPVFGLEEITELADFIEERFIKG